MAIAEIGAGGVNKVQVQEAAQKGNKRKKQ